MPLYNEGESGARVVVTVTKEGRSSVDRATDSAELTAAPATPSRLSVSPDCITLWSVIQVIRFVTNRLGLIRIVTLSALITGEIVT